MRIADLKRAVEDVILRPEDNRISDISKRSTIAALDLCQLERGSDTTAISIGAEVQQRGSAATLTSFSCSGEMSASPSESTCSTSVTTSSGPFPAQPPLSMSTSLDTMALRQSFLCRPSFGASRRSSRVLPHLSHTKRKRSNSVSSCMNKGICGTADAVSQVGISSTSMGGASALSLPPTARHTPFRFGDLDERQYAACSAVGIPATSISYHNPVTESSPSHKQEDTLEVLSALNESIVEWPPRIARREFTQATRNPYEVREAAQTTIHPLREGAVSQVTSDESASNSLSFTAFREPSNACDIDELMDCD
uniref:Uncharacterized protein n=2 Tax=Parascaris univalens TaxID=6257 RepID=A0A915BRI2_PARUN